MGGRRDWESRGEEKGWERNSESENERCRKENKEEERDIVAEKKDKIEK